MICHKANSQVTIGSDIALNNVALVDFKEFDTNSPLSNSVTTSTKGLNYPRVLLDDKERLEPCAPTTDANKEIHVGLTVYRIGTPTLSEGGYYWRKTGWQRLVDRLPEAIDGPFETFFQTEEINRGLVLGNLHNDMVPLRFSKTSDRHEPVTLKLPDNGAYAFNVKLYS
ncbi:hypothetical protein [Myroides odoratus]|uniref:Uncharacterized protein n=1 Tax=Myroides odoratus TaxID=256 RepID=A0A9Q6Z326_MYROD|nr:hypothetical protein [Myroides odoratus]EHQ41404.1 hypothetical protein Myrod_0568 [Myroides odoratus DSM 2801]EKB08725.1 hypothetical protein HMPREF9716_00776 [Myroides odoratus CIP 103059]QQT98838.1 hypothetical protein I6I88_11490 [Myroides odoratus]WQD58978.1 hypothetical protein U0010_07490 [Myroides odoratus]STZ32443.1 Uncharacterised protein [Myroides odoratus]